MKNKFEQLAPLFFATRQLIRSKLPHGTGDPNEWMRCETLRFVGGATPAPTMRDIADYLHVKAPSATSVVMLLEREGFVIRKREDIDKRIVRIELTEKGKRRVKKYLSDASKALEEVFSKIPTADVESLTRILSLLQSAHSI